MQTSSMHRWGSLAVWVFAIAVIGAAVVAGLAFLLGRPIEDRPPPISIRISAPVSQARGDASHAAWGGRKPQGPLRLAWRHTDPSGPPFGAPVVGDGMIFATSDALHALGRDGRLRWNFEPESGAPLSAPVLVDELVIVAFIDRGTDTLHVRALRQRSGEERWRFEHPAPGAVYARVAGSSEGIAVAGDVTGAANVWMLEVDGRLRWTAVAKGSPMEYPPALGHGVTVISTQPPIRFDFADQHTNLVCESVEYLHHGGAPPCRVRTHPRQLEVFDALTGTPLWRAPGAAERTGPAAISRGHVVTVARPGLEHFPEDRVIAYEAESGHVASERRLGTAYEFGVSGARVYVADGSHIRVLGLPGLRESWYVSLPILDALLPVRGGLVVAADETVRFLRPDGPSEPLARLPRPSAFVSFVRGDQRPIAMTSTGDALLVATWDGRVLGFVPEGQAMGG